MLRAGVMVVGGVSGGGVDTDTVALSAVAPVNATRDVAVAAAPTFTALVEFGTASRNSPASSAFEPLRI